MSDAPYEIVGVPTAGSFVFTCEHATNLLPEWQATHRDLPLLEDHWGWDIGAADLTRALSSRTGSAAVLSRFSRLICDPNRDPEDESFVVCEVDGHPFSFNRAVDRTERRRRHDRYAEPFHAAIDRTLGERVETREPVRLVSIHSFTPMYLGTTRPMEVGVLFDAYDEEAWRLEGALDEAGFAVALNAPYSGYDGLIYSARRHGQTHGVVYLELEVRQDLIATARSADAVAERIATALAQWT